MNRSRILKFEKLPDLDSKILEQERSRSLKSDSGHQRCSDLRFFESDSSPDPRGRNPDPNPICNINIKSES